MLPQLARGGEHLLSSPPPVRRAPEGLGLHCGYGLRAARLTSLRRAAAILGKQSLEIFPDLLPPPLVLEPVGLLLSESLLLGMNEQMQAHTGQQSSLSASVGNGLCGRGRTPTGHQREACLEVRSPNSCGFIGAHTVLAFGTSPSPALTAL